MQIAICKLATESYSNTHTFCESRLGPNNHTGRWWSPKSSIAGNCTLRYSHVIKGRQVSHLCHACHDDDDDPISEASSTSTCTLLAPRITEQAPMRIPRVPTCLPKLHELRIATWQPEGLQNYETKISTRPLSYLKMLAMRCVPPTTLECHALEWVTMAKSHGSQSPTNLAQTSFISATSIQKCRFHSPPQFFPNPMLRSTSINCYCRF